MSVAEDVKVEKADKSEKVGKTAEGSPAVPSGIAGVVGWPSRKIGEARAFLAEVRSELKKVTWPGRGEVYSTTLVVIATSIFFGFYLWGLDLVFSRALSLAFKRQF
jgi:preprotein translocase subunit SecE